MSAVLSRKRRLADLYKSTGDAAAVIAQGVAWGLKERTVRDWVTTYWSKGIYSRSGARLWAASASLMEKMKD